MSYRIRKLVVVTNILFTLCVTGCKNTSTSNIHTVTFDSKGGSFVAPQKVKHGEKATKPNDPTKDGFEFDKWTYQGEEWSFVGYTVTSDMTLEAIWSLPHVHNWSEPTYEWGHDYSTCTARRVCSENASHVEEETKESTYEDVTIENNDIRRYTVNFNNSAFETQTRDVIIAEHLKAQLHVRTLNKGIGVQWLKNVAAMFEEQYADATNFQEGRKGVKIQVDGDTAIDGAYLNNQVLNDDVYFTEQVDYRDLAMKGKILDITDVLKADLGYLGDPSGTTIESKIDQTMKDYMLVDGKYYGVPFYDSFYGLVYDVSLFKEEGLYLSNTKTFVQYNDPNISRGSDNIAGTPDDGLPSTYEEFELLLDELVTRGITGFATANNAKEYVAEYLHNVVANNEGVESMRLNLSLSGTATTLIDSVDNEGNITMRGATAINQDNGYMMTRQAGRYHALRFLKNVLMKRNDNFRFLDTHTNAQRDFITSKNNASKPSVAMIMEGSWFENEAAATIANEANITGERSDYAIMPIPFINEADAAAKNYRHTYLSLSQSFGVVSSNTSNVALAKEFMKFVHTNKLLSKFTTDTSITRPLNYEVSAEDQSKLSSYAKSLIYLKGHSDIVYPYSNLSKEVNNPAYFKAYHFCWKSVVNGVPFEHPWDYFRIVSGGTVKSYFDGIYNCFESAWPYLK